MEEVNGITTATNGTGNGGGMMMMMMMTGVNEEKDDGMGPSTTTIITTATSTTTATAIRSVPNKGPVEYVAGGATMRQITVLLKVGRQAGNQLSAYSPGGSSTTAV